MKIFVGNILRKGRENFGVQQLPLFNLLKPEKLDWLVRHSWLEGEIWLITKVPRNLPSHEVTLTGDIRNGLIDSIWRVDKESLEMGLKMPSRKAIGCIRDSFVRIHVPAAEEDFTGECWFTYGKIEYRRFGCPLIYWGINSWLRRWEYIAYHG